MDGRMTGMVIEKPGRMFRKILITPAAWSPVPGERVMVRETVKIEGVAVPLAVVECSSGAAKPADDEVAVRVLAFSCNYRDKSWSLHLASEAEKQGRAFGFGSDFVGEVVAVGKNVTGFVAGDRVIGDNAYPEGGGLATVSASAGMLGLEPGQLSKIPPGMTVEEAASFGVSGQTAYGMVRRSGLADAAEGARVLVTAGTSSTSLAVLSALRNVARDVVVISTSAEKAERLRALDVGEVLVVARENYAANLTAALEREVKARGAFTQVFDPFCDIHLPLVLERMAMGGCYVTCGFFRQHNAYGEIERVDHRRAWNALIMNNLVVRGNCLGTREDLERALAEYAAGRFAVAVDSVHPAERAGEFLNRTFGDGGKFGKVVCGVIG